MTDTPDNTVFLTLIKEVKSLLSEIEKLLPLLTDEDSNKKQIVTELQNLTATVMGIASMMNLDELTNTVTLISEVLDDIVKDKLILSPRLIDAISETGVHLNAYCISLETKENVDEKIFQKTLSAFREFGNFSIDSIEKGDSQKEKPEENFLGNLSENEDSDDFFADLDLDIFEEEDLPPDISPDMPSEMTDSGMTDIDPEFLDSFNEESKDHLNNIGQQLNQLSPSINNRTAISDGYREMLHSIRRSVHTLKGAAAVIGLKPVANFGNEFEDFLDWLHDDSDSLSPEIITVMLDSADILEKLTINPVIKIDNEIDEIKNVFKTIIADSSDAVFEEKQKTEPESIDEPIDQPVDQ
ncbi:MAG: Hpt domain-containing protein, partial [Desulfobacteraceae bacterium]|nr:Hpt domain-containing protein [Desulfobacteraceae bacterium]